MSVFLREDGLMTITIQPRGVSEPKFHPNEFATMLFQCLSKRKKK